ncbi:tumor necrosis factor receptor superfamily member 14 isoform X2 [Homo sapiens]|uniref:tumor necrosis factor receptor superfamily member 14 isoform X2 n=1 Tax=Homo sapiens TaxID=9606 RepID=UPI0003EAFA99|nr:tumor necrosis factor receptor superfamily member 14 isoform X2 [Homo sapiens]XP_054184590.1 tumor necrosis factor receptor superfamily member 14 isoform X2 [Homo sapiens]XP_054195389.1 tumor necrosis factor receptor superfamily member 14 isoform X2 [Homo sapiens]|eukprot:XP_011540685.1 tumor necrosis factor receptor superfamily member 14 isoform X2 [Homo sapiens]
MLSWPVDGVPASTYPSQPLLLDSSHGPAREPELLQDRERRVWLQPRPLLHRPGRGPLRRVPRLRHLQPGPEGAEGRHRESGHPVSELPPGDLLSQWDPGGMSAPDQPSLEKSDRPLRSHPGAATSPASLGPVFTAWGPGSQGGSLRLSEHWALHLPLPRPRPHSRRCSWLVTKAGAGTSSSHWVWWFLSGSLVIVIVCSTVGLIICVKRRKPRGDVVKVIVSVQRKRQEAEGEATVIEALQAPPDVTTVAVEETIPSFTGRSPNH